MASQAAQSKNMAGPVMRTGEIADAVVEAAREDNPDKEIVVVDHISYIRIEAEGGMTIRRDTVEEYLGRPFQMREPEVNLCGFAGQIDTQEDFVRFYLEKKL